MSGLTPSQMLCGKLFGGTVFAWYIGALLIALYLVSDGLNGASPATLLRNTLSLIAVALVFHCVMIMSLLSSWKKQGERMLTRTRHTSTALWLLVLLLFPWLMLGNIFRLGRNEQIGWFGANWSGATLLMLTLIALAIWFIIGTWRLLRAELQYRNGPWAWLLFLLFWMVYFAGFVDTVWQETSSALAVTPWIAYLLICAVAVLASAYLQLFYERHDAMVWLRLTAAWRQRTRLQHLIPLWSTSYALAALIMAAAIMLGIFQLSGQQTLRVILCCTGFLAFALRDIALVLWLNLARDNRRADGAAIICLLVLYVLLPLLVRLGFGDLHGLFYPAIHPDTPALFILSPLLQAMLAVWLLTCPLFSYHFELKVLAVVDKSLFSFPMN